VVTSQSGQKSLYGVSVPIEADALMDEPMSLRLSLGKSSDLFGSGDEHVVEGVALSPSGENGLLTLGTGLWEVEFTIPASTALTRDADGHPVVGGAFSAGAGYPFSEVHVDSIGLSYSRGYTAKTGDTYLYFEGPHDGELGYEVELPDRGYPWVFAHNDAGALVRIIVESAPRSTDSNGDRIRQTRFSALLGADQFSDSVKYWVGGRIKRIGFNRAGDIESGQYFGAGGQCGLRVGCASGVFRRNP